MATLNGTELDDLIEGTPEADNISGNGGDDTILAAGGDDTLRGGDGDDLIDGGAGTDQVRYDRVFEGVAVDLAAGTASDGWRDTDTLISIEDIRGSVFDDTLVGSESANQILGDAGDDLILGAGGADELFGEAGDDTLDGGAGDDRLNGGDGIDTALYADGWGNYILRLGEGGLIVEDKRDGGAGADRLEEMELLVFGDGASLGAEGAVDLSLIDGAAELPEAELTSLVELYAACFGRAPDGLGLAYWATRMGEGMSLAEIAASFFEQPETLALYPDPEDSAALVDAAYANLLDRGPDAAGRAYWIGELDSGAVSRPEFLLAFIDGAKAETGSGDDARTIAQKAEIGLRYSADEGLTDLSNASAAMEAYDSADPDGSLAEALALIDSFAQAAADPGSTELVVQITGLVFGTEPLPDVI